MKSSIVLLAVVVSLAQPHHSQAHYIFLLPPTEGKSATVLFADVPEKDEQIDTARIELKVAHVLSASGVSTEVPTVAQPGGWRVELPEEAIQLRANLEYGIVNRGEGQLIRIRHFARLVLGNTDDKPAGAFDISPVKVAGGTAFRVTLDGKPVAGTEVTVHEPETTLLKVLKADADGITPAFAKPGRYSVRAVQIDKSPGEFEGRKYTLLHSYATLTVLLK